MTSGPIVAFRDVTKTYGEGSGRVHALDGVTVDIQPGEFTAVMGPSGSGKSTFMNLAAGLDDPTSGEVWVAGQPLHALDDDGRTVLRRTHVGFVFQAFNLVPTLSAIENVLLPFELAGRRLGADERAWVDTLMRSLGWPTAPRTGPASCPEASSNASPSPARSRPGRRSSCRRADRQPGHPLVPRGARAAAHGLSRVPPDHRDGQPRPGRRVVRRPHPRHRRRPDRRRPSLVAPQQIADLLISLEVAS